MSVSELLNITANMLQTLDSSIIQHMYAYFLYINHNQYVVYLILIWFYLMAEISNITCININTTVYIIVFPSVPLILIHFICVC